MNRVYAYLMVTMAVLSFIANTVLDVVKSESLRVCVVFAVDCLTYWYSYLYADGALLSAEHFSISSQLIINWDSGHFLLYFNLTTELIDIDITVLTIIACGTWHLSATMYLVF